jgi:hypothetical protein
MSVDACGRKYRRFAFMAWAWSSIGINEQHRPMERRTQAMTKCATWVKLSSLDFAPAGSSA